MSEQNLATEPMQSTHARKLGWHFANDEMRDGRPLPQDGVKLFHDGPLSLCVSGLHASERVLDALKYAPGNMICRVECNGVAGRQDDKLVCSSRTILWRIDGEELLRDFARKVALDVAGLWSMPDAVRKFLETGDDNFRIAARAEARELSRAYVLQDDVTAAAAAEAARAAAARTHAARATGLAAAWAANRASGAADTWVRYDALLESLIEDARSRAENDDDEWSDFDDAFEMDLD